VSDFLALARPSFAFLERERGYEPPLYEPSQSFDNAELEYRSAAMRVRVLRERGQVFVDLGPALGVPAYWFDLPVVLCYLGERGEADRLVAGGQRDVAAVAELLRRHYDRIAPLFAPARYAETTRHLTELRRVRADQMFGPGPR
jgi:hypothetical protein